VGTAEVAQAARRLPPASQRPGRGDLLLEGLTVLFTDGYEDAMPLQQRTLRAFREDEPTVEEGLRWLWLASAVAADVWDYESWSLLSARHEQMARATGALSELPLALSSRAMVFLFAGELDAVASVVQELNAVQHATGMTLAPYGELGLAAWRGRERQARELIEVAMGDVVARGEGIGVTTTQWAKALLLNGLGRFPEAVVAARQAAEQPHELASANWGLSELVEAAARSGRPELAADAFSRLKVMTNAAGTDWALGTQARAQALLSDGDAAERLYREALARFDRTHQRAELARSHLLYGEWLRRAGRRVDAREQLRAAHEVFADIRAEAFAERSRRELLATGETVHKRRSETRDALTPQETQIARLAAEGETNPEIGARLFISPRTVEYHLGKVFRKLNVSSRWELAEALPLEAASFQAG
jgi:DNA-binding CsgD family transcriptional regulator